MLHCRDGLVLALTPDHAGWTLQGGTILEVCLHYGHSTLVHDADLKPFAVDVRAYPRTDFAYVPVRVVDAILAQHGGLTNEQK